MAQHCVFMSTLVNSGGHSSSGLTSSAGLVAVGLVSADAAEMLWSVASSDSSAPGHKSILLSLRYLALMTSVVAETKRHEY